MEKKYYIIIIAILVLLNVFSWRMWWESPRHKDFNLVEQAERKGGRRGGGMSFFVERLDLTASQKSDFEKLKKSYFSEIKAINDSMNVLRKRLLKTIGNEVDTDVRSTLFKDMGAYKLHIEMLTMEHFNNMRKLCNPQQIQKFDTLMIHILDRSPMFNEVGKSHGKFRRGEGKDRHRKE